MANKKYTALLACFFLLIAVYALSIVLGWAQFSPLLKTLPVLLLALLTFLPQRFRNVWLPLALLLSACGDYMGAVNMFIWQIAFFALAHIAYIVYFLRNFRYRLGSLPLSIVIVAAALLLGLKIVPGITNPAEKVFIIIYIVIISTMAVSTIFYGGRGRWWNIAAALLFMFSDTLIAWNLFVAPVPNRGLWIMSTYYLAQFIFAANYLLSQRECKRA